MTAKISRMETLAADAGTTGHDWQILYRAGAIAALLVVLAGLLDIFIMFLPGTGTSPGVRTVVDWFGLLQGQCFLALRDLGLLNIVTMSFSVVVFFALVGMHRRINPLAAGLALILASMGAAIYISTNVGLPMLTLSRQYAAAAGEGQKALWAAAGQALLGQEDLTTGAFPGFFFAEIAGLLMAVVALRGHAFRPCEAWIGIAGTACLLLFNFCAAFIPALYDSVMLIFGAGGGLLSMVWYAVIANRLFRMNG